MKQVRLREMCIRDRLDGGHDGGHIAHIGAAGAAAPLDQSVLAEALLDDFAGQVIKLLFVFQREMCIRDRGKCAPKACIQPFAKIRKSGIEPLFRYTQAAHKRAALNYST